MDNTTRITTMRRLLLDMVADTRSMASKVDITSISNHKGVIMLHTNKADTMQHMVSDLLQRLRPRNVLQV